MKRFPSRSVLGIFAALTAFGAQAEEQKTPPGGIAWFGTWNSGVTEAARTGRPIMLVSAAPHCHQVPGVW